MCRFNGEECDDLVPLFATRAISNSAESLWCDEQFLPLIPPGWRGIVVTVRAGGRLPNLRNPYLCNLLMDFLHSKFCGIV